MADAARLAAKLYRRAYLRWVADCTHGRVGAGASRRYNRLVRARKRTSRRLARVMTKDAARGVLTAVRVERSLSSSGVASLASVGRR